MQLIIKQQTGKKMIKDLQNNVQFLCTARTIEIWYTLIRQVAALWHVKN